MMKMRIILASILMLALFAGVSQAALTDGLIAYWDFEDDGVDVISDRTISDLGNRGQYTESENGLVGKYTRVWASDNVAHPNGTGFKGSIGDLYSAGGITDEMTISTWYGFGNPQGGASVVPFGGYGARAGTQVYDLNAGTRMMASMCKFRNTGGSSIDYYDGWDQWQSGGYNWLHLVTRIKSDGTIETFYANGDRPNQDTGLDFDPASGPSLVRSATLPDYDIIQNFDNETMEMAYIEAKPQAWFFSIDVNFDEIGIWNRALSDLELQAVYDAGLSGTPLPEPATLVVLGLGGLAVLIRRKR